MRLTIFGVDESEARDIEVVGKVVEGCIGGRLEGGTGAEDTFPFAPTVVQTLLLLDGGGDVAATYKFIYI